MPRPPLFPPAPPDPVASLAACHDRIRTFTAGLQRVAALPDLADPRVPAAAAQAHRYFAVGLPLHADDEDLSFAPRLLAAAPGLAPLLGELAADHRAIDVLLARLLPLLDALAQGRLVDPDALRATSDALAGLLLPHIAREEQELFGACAALPEEVLVAVAREIAERRATAA